MKKLWLAVAAAVCLLLVGMVFWRVQSNRNPIVNGKSLGHWLEEYRTTLTGGGQDRMAKQETARAAVRQLGTNAIPELLCMLRQQDGKVSGKLRQFGDTFLHVPYKPAWIRNYEGQCGFEILGADAEVAVPALIQIYERPPSSSSQASVAMALAAIGPAASTAIPFLLQGTTNSDRMVRADTVTALGLIHSYPATVVPALIGCLNDSDLTVRIAAARSLGHYGPEARQAIPALVKARATTKGNTVDLALTKIEQK